MVRRPERRLTRMSGSRQPVWFVALSRTEATISTGTPATSVGRPRARARMQHRGLVGRRLHQDRAGRRLRVLAHERGQSGDGHRLRLRIAREVPGNSDGRFLRLGLRGYSRVRRQLGWLSLGFRLSLARWLRFRLRFRLGSGSDRRAASSASISAIRGSRASVGPRLRALQEEVLLLKARHAELEDTTTARPPATRHQHPRPPAPLPPQPTRRHRHHHRAQSSHRSPHLGNPHHRERTRPRVPAPRTLHERARPQHEPEPGSPNGRLSGAGGVQPQDIGMGSLKT